MANCVVTIASYQKHEVKILVLFFLSHDIIYLAYLVINVKCFFLFYVNVFILGEELNKKWKILRDSYKKYIRFLKTTTAKE